MTYAAAAACAVQEAAPPPSPSTTRDDEWLFLLPWLDRVVLYPHDRHQAGDVRVAGDASDRFWLTVALEREDVLLQHALGEAMALREIHEAIVLMHLLARVKPDLWYEWLVVDERCYLTPWFVREEHTVEFKYAFDFHDAEHMDLGFLAWEDSLEWLLAGGRSPSDAFQRDLARVQELLQRHGVLWRDLAPIPILLRLNMREQVRPMAIVNRVAQLVRELRLVEEGLSDEDAELPLHRGRGTLFRVTSLELDVSEATLSTGLLHALQEILELGVDVDFLGLPELTASGRVHREIASISQVGRFMRTLLGISTNPNGDVTRVRHLQMPIGYLETFMFAPFCSALASARYLRVFEITNSNDYEALDSDLERRRHVWSWLAFALFSSASTCSVEALILDGVSIRSSDVRVIQDLVDSEDPLATLCEYGIREIVTVSSTDTTAIKTTSRRRRPTVEVTFEGMWAIRNGEFDIFDTIPFTAMGEVMRFQDGDGDKDSCMIGMVFVPGLGFCEARGHQFELASKKRRLDAIADGHRPNSPLHTLVVKSSQWENAGVPALRELLSIVGPRLRSLSVKLPDVHDENLVQIFAACPRLENFALSNARLASMDAFTDAYGRHRLPLSSLTLSGLSVPENQFQHFLRNLLQHNALEATLCRLDIGKHWAHELSTATLAIVRNVLDHNKTLTHMKLNVSDAQCRWVRLMCDRYHGHRVDGLSYTERLRRLSTLGALRHLAQTNPRLALNDDTKRLVLAFAAPRPIHRVVNWSTTRIGGPIRITEPFD